MTDKIEIQGKTVDEAVSEALLKMGARRDEVDVTVLEEPKNGFLGILGGRPARVVVRKRRQGRGGRRDFRRNDGHTPHSLDGGEGGRSRGRRGGRRSAARPDRGDDATAEARTDGRRGRRDDAPSEGSRGGGESRRNDRGDDGRRDAQAGEGTRRRRGRRGGRGRGRGRGTDRQDRNATAQGAPQEQPGNERNEARNERKDGGRDGRRDGNRRDVQAGEGTRRRRGRRGGRGRGREDQNTRMPEQPIDTTAAELNMDPVAERRAAPEPAQRPEPAARMEPPVEAREQRDERPAAARVETTGRDDDGMDDNRQDERPMEASNMAPDEEIASGIPAKRYAEPLRTAGGFETQDEMLGTLASGMLVRAGFPCRCEVVPDEYSLVKIVTDDSSAGMLIGRHGQTVDAVEHLVERMAHTVAGDRVFMNLDINNYRRRREETLQDRSADAISSVRNTGEEYHMEPMNARERRIVHLEAEQAGLHTRTEAGQGGKHVVISAVPMIDEGPDEDLDEEFVEEAAPAVDEVAEPEAEAGTAPEEERALEAAPEDAPEAEPAEEIEASAEGEDEEEPRADS